MMRSQRMPEQIAQATLVAQRSVTDEWEQERPTMKTILNIGIVASLMAWPLAAQQQHHQGAVEQPSSLTHCEIWAGGMMSGGMMGDSTSGGMMGGDSTSGGMMGGDRMSGGMMGMSMEAMRLMPSHVLNQREALQFTTEQTAKLEAIGAEMSNMQNHVMARNGDAEAVAIAFRAHPVDSAAMNHALQKMADRQAAMHERYLLLAARVRDVLTADQLEKLESLPSPCQMGDAGSEREHDEH